MPPKTVPKAKAVSADFVGAKFCTLAIGESSDPIKVKVNLNCALDVVLDCARKGLIFGVDSKIRDANVRIEELSGLKVDEADAEPANEVEKGKLALVVKQLLEFKQLLEKTNVSKLELYDEGGAILNCQQVFLCSYFL